MTTNVLICDDSGFARRQMARSVPDGWDVAISYAENGAIAIEKIRQGLGDVMFLDLNMPVMDGYEAMQIIRDQDLPCLVIVVSGDVQPEARARMKAMGALDFIQKPIDNNKLSNLLKQYGIYTGESSARNRQSENALSQDTEDSRLDAYREMVNVAMGRAGESLAKVLNEFVDLPIPNVNLIETNELHMAIAAIHRDDNVSAISKGFVSAGISGEALLIFNDSNIKNIVDLLKYPVSGSDEQQQLEALMDISNILIGACLNALSSQLNVCFSHVQPILLGQNKELGALLDSNISRWRKMMAIEIAYSIKSRNISFDLLLLFPDESMNHIYTRLVNTSDE